MAWLARAVAAVFGAVAAARGRPALHPVGEVYSARLRVTARPGVPGVPMLRHGRRFRALVRASRATGLLPSWCPDALGLAIRLPRRLGRGSRLDLLLTSSGAGPLGRRVPRPRGSFLRRQFSSLLPYHVGGAVAFLGARPARGRHGRSRGAALPALRAAVGQAPVSYELLLARRLGPWRPVGVLELRRPLGRDPRLKFNPWHAARGLRPAGRINRIRDPVYRASQRRAP